MAAYSLNEGTEVYGNLSDADLNLERERIRASGFEQNGLHLDFFENDGYGEGFFAVYNDQWSYSRNSTLGFLIPHNMIALIFDEGKTRTLNPDYKKHLTELGYTVSDWVRPTKYDRKWSRSNQLWLSRESRKKGLDERTVEILEKLGENLDLEDSLLRFASFEIGIKTFTEVDYGRVLVNQEFRPETTFFDIPFEKAVKRLSEIYKSLPLTSAIGLTSQVVKQGKTYHIPMMDIDDSSLHFGDIKDLKMNGMRVLSGIGEHFYGFRLIEEREYADFLEDIWGTYGIDYDWISFQRKQGFMLLRLTPSRHRLYQPCFDKILDPQTCSDEYPIYDADFFYDEFGDNL